MRNSSHNPAMAPIWLGTSGFSYKEWRPIFYPEDLSDKQFLQYYGSRFNSVEIDYTFYRMPTAKTIEAWRRQPRRTSGLLKGFPADHHRQRLKVPSNALEYLLSVVTGLENRLGLVLYQLPPFFKCDIPEAGNVFVCAAARPTRGIRVPPRVVVRR